MAEAFLINPISTRRPMAKGKRKLRRKHMARRRRSSRRRLFGAAAAAHARKVGRRNPVRRHRRKARLSVRRRRSRRNPHVVRSHVQRIGRRRVRVRRHMSNPNWGAATIDGLVLAGVLFGALFVVGVANKQTEKVGVLQSGWGNLAAKLGVGLLGSIGALMLVRKGWLSQTNAKVVAAASFAPLLMSGVRMISPALASNVSLAGDDGDLGATLGGFFPQELGMRAGPRLSDYTIDAELSAELGGRLERETETSAY